MREIKFRAWDTEKNKMVKVDTIDFYNGNVNDVDFYNQEIHFGYSTVLMQYTGLKDKNGTEIYEGDILLSASYPSDHMLYNPKKGVAEFYDGSFIFNQNNPRTSARLDVFVNTSIVIGNIYEHKHLLEESK